MRGYVLPEYWDETAVDLTDYFEFKPLLYLYPDFNGWKAYGIALKDLYNQPDGAYKAIIVSYEFFESPSMVENMNVVSYNGIIYSQLQYNYLSNYYISIPVKIITIDGREVIGKVNFPYNPTPQ